jgi:RNA recognition motif-containing protein
LPPLPKEDTNRAQFCPPPPPGLQYLPHFPSRLKIKNNDFLSIGTPPSADQLTPKPVTFSIGYTSGVAQPDSSTQDNQKFTSSSHNQRITTGTTAFEKRDMPFDGTSPVSSSEDISDPPPPGEACDPVCPLSKSPPVPEGKLVKPLMPWRRSSSHSTQSQSSEPEGENRSVYVGKLNPITTSDSLRKTFSKYGTVM